MFKRDLELEKRLGGLFVRATKYGEKVAMDTVVGYALPAVTERVCRWCDKKGHSRGFADIVACETVMKALAKARTFDSSRPLMPWLTGIAWHEFAELCEAERRLDERYHSLSTFSILPSQNDDELNKARRRDILEPLDELVRREDDARGDELRELLDAAIPSLPELKRQVVELYRAGNSVGVIAATLTLPPAHVSKILFDAKEELRRRIG